MGETSNEISRIGKLEIIRLVEQSALGVHRTLEKLGILRATFYRWYDQYRRGGLEALSDRSPRPDRVLEPHPRCCQGAGCRSGLGDAGTVAPAKPSAEK